MNTGTANPPNSPLRAPESERATRILLVDDEAPLRGLLSRCLSAEGYDCVQAASSEEAWEALEGEDFALLITDIKMPGMSGLELLGKVAERFPSMAVIMVTAVADHPVALDALEKGAYGYVIKPFSENEVLVSVANALERQRLAKLSEQYEHRLEQEVRDRTAEIRRVQEEVSLRLVSASEYRDEETGAHIRRMGMFAEALAKAMGWDADAADNMRLAAPMHDIGKIGVSDTILLKPGKLTDTEFQTMQQHTQIGAAILKVSDIRLLQMSRDIALCHHEKWDGSGYPQGLKGEDIPECARMVAIADVYDALVHDRVYRPAFSEEEALAIMTKEKGRHFDPRLFESFVNTLDELRRIRREVAD